MSWITKKKVCSDSGPLFRAMFHSEPSFSLQQAAVAESHHTAQDSASATESHRPQTMAGRWTHHKGRIQEHSQKQDRRVWEDAVTGSVRTMSRKPISQTLKKTALRKLKEEPTEPPSFSWLEPKNTFIVSSYM